MAAEPSPKAPLEEANSIAGGEGKDLRYRLGNDVAISFSGLWSIRFSIA